MSVAINTVLSVCHERPAAREAGAGNSHNTIAIGQLAQDMIAKNLENEDMNTLP